MKSLPFLSIIMAVYNDEKYLETSILSILNQTFEDFEFIIINDGSNDNSPYILNEYNLKDKRIIVIEQKNRGVSKSLNNGIMISKGRYIARQDADDVSLPTRLEKQFLFLQANSNYGLVGSNWDYIDEHGDKIVFEKKYFLEQDDEIRSNIVKFNPFCHSSVIFRKEVCDTVGLYNEKLKYAQDYEYWIRIMTRYKVANLRKILVSKRLHKEAISNAGIKKQIFYSIKIKVFAIQTLSLPIFNYISVIDSIFNFILPISFSKRIEKIKIAIRNIFKKILNIG